MKRLLESLKSLAGGSRAAAEDDAIEAPAANTPAAVKELLEQARARLKAGSPAEGLKLTQQAAAAAAGPVPGLLQLQAACLEEAGRHDEALAAFEAELAAFPRNAAARKRRDGLAAALARPTRKHIPTAQRPWHTNLPHPVLSGIQQALHNYTYRGVPMLKNPFDFALYPMLLWQLKPRTLIEIGSKSGGSGLWFGDLINNFNLDTRIHSIDIVKVEAVTHPRVTFHEGDGRNLGRTLTADFLKNLPRPWLVIEDADHAYETSIAVLKFFHPLLEPGEYIIVEDGIISDLNQDEDFNSGPHRALKEFLRDHAGEYEIDADYCDFYGYNLTWSTNGFLKKCARAQPGDELARARECADQSRTADAFAILNRIKARRVPVRDADLLRARCFLAENQPGSALEALREELRFFPDNQAAAELLKKLSPPGPAKTSATDPELTELLTAIRPYTMVGEARLQSLCKLAREVCARDVPGNFVECGVAAGGSSALLASVIQRHSKRPRRLFSFDSFEGMPPATAQDRSHGKTADATGWGAGTCAAPEASLREVCRKLGVEQLVTPVKGLFADTLPAHRAEIGPIAFLHMDGDWYASTLDILNNLFDQVVPGGLIQIDDYGYWEGCKRAVSEFEQARGLKSKLTRIDETGVWLAR